MRPLRGKQPASQILADVRLRIQRSSRTYTIGVDDHVRVVSVGMFQGMLDLGDGAPTENPWGLFVAKIKP